MKDKLKRLRRRAVLESLNKGIKKASILLIGCETQKESHLLVCFLSNASTKMVELKNNRHVADVEIKELFGENEALVRNLKEKANVSTVQDLLVSELSSFRSALKRGKLPFQEILYAMRPLVIGASHPRADKARSDEQSED